MLHEPLLFCCFLSAQEFSVSYCCLPEKHKISLVYNVYLFLASVSCIQANFMAFLASLTQRLPKAHYPDGKRQEEQGNSNLVIPALPVHTPKPKAYHRAKSKAETGKIFLDTMRP